MRRYLLLTLSALLVVIGSYAQDAVVSSDAPLKKLIALTQSYQSGRLTEKVHLHLDKPYYAIGDNIWFKAYVVLAEKNQPSNLSKILYVDLIDELGSIKQTLKLPLMMGLAWGEFTLTDSLKEGNYRVRAYTTWMRNFGGDYFFDKTISIGNAITNNIITAVNYTYSREGASQKVEADLSYKDINGNPIAGKEVGYDVHLGDKSISRGEGRTDGQGNLSVSFFNSGEPAQQTGMISTIIKLDDKRSVTKDFPIKATSDDITIQFFPEGGDLVAGLASKVAFKATGAGGRGVPVNGYLTDMADNRIAEFKSEHAGMGVFTFRPQAATSYKAVIRLEDGSEKSFDLPAVQSAGYVLSAINTDGENLTVRISATPDYANQEVIILVQSNNKIHFVSKGRLTGTRLTTSIPKNKFPEGILHLTLFSAQNEPLVERLVFISHQEQLNIDISTPEKEFSKREKVKLSMDVTNKAGKPVLGSFSVSVVDETKVPYDEINETTILSNLLLTSDLKGYVQSPNYYFTAVDEEKVRHLDMLMLTHGGRRFVWKDILNEPHPALAYQPEQSMSLSGQVTMSGKPVANGKVTLFYNHGKPLLIDTITDTMGRFSFNNLYFADSTKFVVQARNTKNRKDVKLELDQVPRPPVTESKNLVDSEVNVNYKMINYLRNSALQFDSLRRMTNGSIALQEVEIVDKKIEIPYSTNLNGAGNADAVITAKELARCQDLRLCLGNMVAGMVLVQGTPFLIRSLKGPEPLPMLIIVDGIETEADQTLLASINPNDIEAIEVLKSGGNIFIYGPKGRHGVLLITTKRIKSTIDGNSGTGSPGVVKVSQKGFHKVREFYSPDYDELKNSPSDQDHRTTIYWNPQVITGKDGKTSVEFFNADGTGNYRVIVEGINETGNIGRSVYRYKVK